MHTAKNLATLWGSVSGGMSSKLFGHLMSFLSIESFNQNTFNLQDWLILIACWSLIKIFCKKITFERNISWFQNNRKTKERHASFKDEMWSQNKKCDIAQQYDWQFIAILESSFLAISVFCLAIPITRHSEDVLVTKWSMTSSFTNWARFLKLLHLFNWNGRGPHHDIPSLVWIIPPRKWWLHGICQSQEKVWNLADVSSPTWVAERCQSWQRHLSS